MLTFRRKIFLCQAFCIGFFTLSFFFIEKIEHLFLLFCIYSVVSGWKLHRITLPLQRIIDAIVPLKTKELPHPIVLDPNLCGEFEKLGLFLNSLTERIQKQALRSEEQKVESEGILHSLEEGVIALDKQGIITFANKAACVMLEMKNRDLLGCSFHSFATHADLSYTCHELVQQVLQTSEGAEENWAKGKVHMHLAALPRVKHNGVILVIQNRTSEYRMVKMGTDFIANASHELRTPITIIRGFAETLQEHPQLSLQIIQEIGGKIMRTSRRLERLIQSLLTLADLENVLPEQFQRVDLTALVQQCRDQFLQRQTDISLRLIIPSSSLLITADPLLLEFAIMNLLDNAVKYSAEMPRITLSLYSKDSHSRIEVRDEGIGIPKEDLPHIFDRFYRVDKARSRASGGAGLGLAIVKTIAQKHKGQVEVMSRLSQGSTFTLALPL
ncbi:MAG: PAS domain-containing protein [Verrucomicrobiota bacterium]|nr:PAS domain-containing protein [Verrucomicrobiota bacterium]